MTTQRLSQHVIRSLLCVILLPLAACTATPSLPQAGQQTSDATAPTATSSPSGADGTSAASAAAPSSTTFTPGAAALDLPIVFVSRQINSGGSIYMPEANDMPGVGPHSRFRPAAPGALLVREADGRIRTLIDGSTPTAQSLNLIDVNAPAVSYDGTTIVFAGLPAGDYENAPAKNPNAWRLYSIRADGTGLRQITTSDKQPDLSQFGGAAQGLAGYDDTDPAWLPDGRIVFSSTRWPSFGQYSGVRTTNLFVVHADGTDMRRITSERNGADRPLVDPQTGKIVYARWWRNHRFPLDDQQTVNEQGVLTQQNGLSARRDLQLGGTPEEADALWRNAWQAATINPDGTGLALWAGDRRDEEGSHVYGGAFTPDGALIANYFPMFNMTEAAGFGGLRRFEPGAGSYAPIAGITSLTLDYVNAAGNVSYGIFKGSYASEPAVLPDGRLIYSLADDTTQDYRLVVAQPDGSQPAVLLDRPGTSEVRAQVLAPRPLPPIIADTVQAAAPELPPTADGDYDASGTFSFEDLNVYANAPVDVPIVSAPPVGSAHTIRFYMDQQRTSPGSFPEQDWPILLGEMRISPSGALATRSPADVPLFEQVRAADGSVPRTGGPNRDGAAHVAGMNFGRPGEVVRCVGCHAGHSLMPVPADPAEAQWSNLAPGAAITASSTRDERYNTGLIDRQVMRGEIWRYWSSKPGEPSAGQWVQLTFPVPVSVQTVRLYNARPGDEAQSTAQVEQATVLLYADAAATQEVGQATSGPVSLTGTDVAFAPTTVRAVRVRIDTMSGAFYGADVATLAEIEVIARGE